MLISEHADFQTIKETLLFLAKYERMKAEKKDPLPDQLASSIAGACRAMDRLSRKPIEGSEALTVSLSDAADAIDQVVQWMNDYALPRLGDDSDGGNSLSAGLEMKAEEIRDLLKASK